MNKRGFTLIELMVYIAIVGIVVIVAGQAFSDSTKTRLRTQSMIEANKVAENAGILLQDDIAQMGAKASYNSSKSSYNRHNVYADSAAGDFSSFRLFPKPAVGDSLVFWRVINKADGSFLRTEEVSWFVTESAGKKTLRRGCRTLMGEADSVACVSGASPSVVEIAENVEEFKVIPAKPSVLGGGDGVMFPLGPAAGKFRLLARSDVTRQFVSVTVSPTSGAKTVNVSGFATNYPDTSDIKVRHQVFIHEIGSTESRWRNCKQFMFKKGFTYEISFAMPNNGDETRMFQPGKDHLSVGLRLPGDGLFAEHPDVPDMFFYPASSDEGVGERRMRFSINSVDSLQACIAFTFASFSPSLSAGILSIADFRLKRVADANYTYDESYVTSTAEKKNVRAFQVRFSVKSRGEMGRVVLEIPVPSNGLKAD